MRKDMNREGEKRSVSRSQKQQKTQQQLCVQRKKNEVSYYKEAHKEARSGASESVNEVRSMAPQGKRQRKVSPTAESPRSPGAHRKLSDASNTSEDLSKDSGCLSAKLSSSDSSSEISDCPSDGIKRDSPSSDNELSWIDGGVYESLDGERKEEKEAQEVEAAGAPKPGLFHSPGAFIELMMGETTEDLAREVEDLRSENEYLKDELEELRCEMLEMRDMFQEEEVYQLQQLRLQLDQANKTCRILQYRLRKAERRSIRVAQTGQVDGELVRSLEHDIKVAKSVSLRLYNELEAVLKKNSQLEWENEVLREKTQELEVAKQVLQTEAEKAREGTVKKKSIRSSSGKAEKRLSQIEDDSADLRCQLHFAKEELALMCKKLTKLVSESEGMQDELTKYRSVYGDIHNAQLPEGKHNSAHVREAEVKVHLKLVEEEATLLSRRIVELEVENRGLRAEMSDLKEKIGTGGAEEDEEIGDNLLSAAIEQDREAREQSLKMGSALQEQGMDEITKLKAASQMPLVSEEKIPTCDIITREGPVGGEWDPSESHEGSSKKHDSSFKLMSQKHCETLLALRDHSCILSSAIQLLMMPPKNGHCSSPSCTYASLAERDLKKTQSFLPGPLNEALELFQAMLLAFIRRVEVLLNGEDLGRLSPHKGEEGCIWEPCVFTFSSGDSAGDIQKSPSKQDCVEDLRTAEVKERAKQTKQAALAQSYTIQQCKDPKMQQCLQILWALHQWCQEDYESTNQTMLVLSGLLQDLAARLQDEKMRFDSESRATQSKAAECTVSSVFHSEQPSVSARTRVSKGTRRHLSLCNTKMKNWCYMSQEAAQLDREDPVKTWDHLIMPLSFPDLDFEQMSMERSHTAPEKTAVRIYYSPPSRRRVQLAQLKQSPVVDRESVTTASPWCTPPTSFSPLCLGSSANLSDDMKEITASRRHTQGTTRYSSERWENMACSGTQTQMRPQMVSVALQTDGTQGPVSVRSPTRVLNSPLMSDKTHHISTSMNGVAGRLERPRPSSTSPKLRRHSTSSSLPSFTSSSSSSSSSSSRDRALWSLSHQNHTGLAWTRQTGQRVAAGQTHSSVSSEQPDRSTKPPTKPAASNKCGLVTEFLRRVSGRADKPVQRTGHKTKNSTLKNLERVPTRPSAAPLQRNDSVTRIVNQRFMKQREDRANSLSQGVRSNPVPGEDANYECSSSSTLTFCFARPSRPTQRPTSYQSKVQSRRYTQPNSSCA